VFVFLFIIQLSRVKGKKETSLSLSPRLQAVNWKHSSAVRWVSRTPYNHDVFVYYAIYVIKHISKTIRSLVRIVFWTIHFHLKLIGNVDARPEEQQPEGRQCLCCCCRWWWRWQYQQYDEEWLILHEPVLSLRTQLHSHGRIRWATQLPHLCHNVWTYIK